MENNNQSDEFSTMNIESINIDEILKNEPFEEDEQSNESDEEDTTWNQSSDEIQPISIEEDIAIDDADIKEIEEKFQSYIRGIENLTIEYQNLKKQCDEKKQEIKVIKEMTFSHDCRNDMEMVYNSIEIETCKSIQDHASDISKNIRINKDMAKISLRKLKKNTDLLTLQLDYTNIIEHLFSIYADYVKLKNKHDILKPEVSCFDVMREEKRQQARREQENRLKIMKIKNIINQQ